MRTVAESWAAGETVTMYVRSSLPPVSVGGSQPTLTLTSSAELLKVECLMVEGGPGGSKNLRGRGACAKEILERKPRPLISEATSTV